MSYRSGIKQYINISSIILIFAVIGVSNIYAKELPKNQITNPLAKASYGVVNVVSATLNTTDLLQPAPQKGSGSGFVIDNLGHILTTMTILSDLRSIEVTFFDGQQWPARFIGYDPETTMAVLEILAPDQVKQAFLPLPFVKSRDVLPGQNVYALGNPFGQGVFISKGIVAGDVRSLLTEHGSIIDLVVQTDAAIGSQNEGGPLLDSYGRVVGMNTLIFGKNSRLGHAVSSEILQNIASQIISTGKVSRPWLGIKVVSINIALANVLRLPVKKGVLVTELIKESPAQKAGIVGGSKELRLGNRIYTTGGDIIVAVDGQQISSDTALLRILQTKQPGDTINIGVLRDGKIKDIKVKLANKNVQPDVTVQVR